MASALVFYNLNGWQLAPSEGDLIHLAVDIAKGNYDVTEITTVFESWAVELKAPE